MNVVKFSAGCVCEKGLGGEFMVNPMRITTSFADERHFHVSQRFENLA